MDAEFWKKLVYMAVGYASINPEKIKELTDHLTSAGKMTEKEGEAFINEMIAKTKAVRTEMEEKIEKISQEVYSKLHLVHREEMDELTRRVASLEQKIGS